MKDYLIDRHALKTSMFERGVKYSEMAALLGLSTSGFAYKMTGRKGRLVPFSEREVQILRTYFGDSILSPSPIAEKPIKAKEQ